MPSREAETARAWLLEHHPAGFEERESGASTELAVYTDGAGLDAVRAAFPDVVAEPVEPGWEERWKEFHRPVVVAGVWIGPPWIAPPSGASTVVVDPGRAFGTGAHPTTRASIELLARVERGSLLDAGCGSGVVALAAARLGYTPVCGVDVDPVAVEIAAETARANGIAAEFRVADVLADELPSADVVVANIELRVVERLLGRAPARVAVTSGYLATERPTAAGWAALERVEVDGWAADVLVAT